MRPSAATLRQRRIPDNVPVPVPRAPMRGSARFLRGERQIYVTGSKKGRRLWLSARALVLEQRVLADLWLSATGAVVYGGQRPPREMPGREIRSFTPPQPCDPPNGSASTCRRA